MTKSTDSAILKTTVLSTILKTIRMRHSLQTSRFAFSSRNGVRFQFTWYQNEMSYQNENFVRIENRNELIPEWLVRDLTFVSVSCKQIQRNIWGWNELVLEWKSFQYHVNGPLERGKCNFNFFSLPGIKLSFNYICDEPSLVLMVLHEIKVIFKMSR